MKELLEIKDLVVHYETDDGIVKALNNINLVLVIFIYLNMKKGFRFLVYG